jgi:hypothetical protein
VACFVKGNNISGRGVSAEIERNKVPDNCKDYILGTVTMRNGDDKENYKFDGWKRRPINALRYFCNIYED